MKVIIYQGDQAGCWYWRCQLPFIELRRFGVEMYHTPVFPSAPGRPGADFGALVQQISKFDLVIVQRLTSLHLMQTITNAAFLTNTPCIYEVDDDYFQLQPSNPCYYGTSLDDSLLNRAREAQMAGRLDELKDIMPHLEENRKLGLQQYAQALPLFDACTVTTNELKSVLLRFNKEIKVLQNNLEFVHEFRDAVIEESDANGKMISRNLMGMRSIPAFYKERHPETFEPLLDENGQEKIHRIVRLLYGGTVSHREDWGTIQRPWTELARKWADKCHFVYMGDPYFYHMQGAYLGPKTEQNPEGDGLPNRRIHIEENTVDMYLLNLRAADIFFAPLSPVPFNESKSDLKALEGASWGACPVLPDFITYSRNWVHGETAMLYKNEKEFYEIVDYLIQNHAVRERIGRQARDYVATERLEKFHSEERYLFYKSVIDKKKKFTPLKPNKEKVA